MAQKRYCHFCAHPLIQKQWEGRIRLFCEQCEAPIYENPIPAVCVIASDAGSRVLLVQRSVDPKIGQWCLPGGFMELGETPADTAIRELAEETGLQGEVGRLVGADSNPSALYHTITLVCYEVTVSGGRLQPGDDAMDAGWFDRHGLPEVAFSSHRTFIRNFFDG